MLLLTSSASRREVRSYAKRAFLTGFAIVLPFLLTLFIISFVVSFFSGFLAPAVDVTQGLFGFDSLPIVVLEVVTAVLFLLVVFLIGVAVESEPRSARVERRFESMMSEIPGVGSIYSNLNEISELLLEQDTESFQEVKLVEYPQEGSYILGFLTAQEPEVVEEATAHDDVITLFAPMGPNPFMGGFVIHVSADQVYDVDLTVEEGIQTIVSSGVAINDLEELEAVDGTAAGGGPA